MKVINTTRNTVLAESCEAAASFFKRFMGLMGRKSLPAGSALLITPCNSIHMCFMRFPLDIVFVDRDGKVVHMIENIRPWRVSRIVSKAYQTLELPCGTIHESRTQTGDQLELA